MTTNATPDGKMPNDSRLKWVPLDQIKVNPAAQRELKQARVDYLVAHLDLDLLGNPIVNERDGGFYVIDGQHRVEALRQFGFADEKIQCWVYAGLTEEEEADRFLSRNDTLTVDGFSRYRVALTAGRDVECDIERVVRSVGLCVSRDKMPGSISAVGTLRRVYLRAGPGVLARSLRIIRDSFGDSGLEAAVIDGLGLLCQRYNGELDEEKAVRTLSQMRGGANGLLGNAETLRRQTGHAKGSCVAAAAVDQINRGRGGSKLPSWWKDAA